MTPTGLARFASHTLRSDILGKSGELLLSGAETLTKGPVYLLGHNPGGSPANKRLSTVRKSIRELSKKKHNSYLDSVWPSGDTLQVRVIWLLAALGFHPRKVPASNLIFVRSKAAAGSRMETYADICWEIHEKILMIVKPGLVLVYGNSERSPYTYLRRKFDYPREQRKRAGHGEWECRSFVVPGRFRVVGLPHLSRYDITAHPEVVHWIKDLSGVRTSTR